MRPAGSVVIQGNGQRPRRSIRQRKQIMRISPVRPRRPAATGSSVKIRRELGPRESCTERVQPGEIAPASSQALPHHSFAMLPQFSATMVILKSRADADCGRSDLACPRWGRRRGRTRAAVEAGVSRPGRGARHAAATDGARGRSRSAGRCTSRGPTLARRADLRREGGVRLLCQRKARAAERVRPGAGVRRGRPAFPVALLQDNGYLTDLQHGGGRRPRSEAAGARVGRDGGDSSAVASRRATRRARWPACAFVAARLVVWGRNPERGPSAALPN